MPRKKLDPVKRTIHVHYALDSDGSWFVKAKNLQGAHSSGRRISAARRNIREAISLVLDVDDSAFDLSETFELADVEALCAAKKLRSDARALADAADQAMRDYVANSQLSVRDLGELLGISFQRVQQLRSG